MSPQTGSVLTQRGIYLLKPQGQRRDLITSHVPHDTCKYAGVTTLLTQGLKQGVGQSALKATAFTYPFSREETVKLYDQRLQEEEPSAPRGRTLTYFYRLCTCACNRP